MPRLKPPLTEEERTKRTAAMEAAQIAQSLKGRRDGRNSWKAKCPAHDDHDPSLHISVGHDGRTLVHCFTGCSQKAVIDALKDRGLWNPGAGDELPRLQIVNNRQFDHDKDRTAVALDIWNASIAARNTAVETYLRSRGITLPIPASLRFHPGLKHGPTGTIWPAMIALITGADGSPVAIHRTYLALDGTCKADVTPAKMTLGLCKGAAVRLGDIQPGQWLAVAEGIETTLSVMQSCGLPGWAALSAGNLKVVKLPTQAAMVTVCADNDSNKAGQRAARTLADRLLRDGLRVRVATPKTPGTDFNDELLKEAQYVD
jgi:hypothetical protein